MWLPKDERKLLIGYYVNIKRPREEKWYEKSSWKLVLESRFHQLQKSAGKVKERGDNGAGKPLDWQTSNVETIKQEIVSYAGFERRFDIASESLNDRGLIKLQKHETQSYIVGVSLTLAGYDLGRKYSRWWIRSGLWFAEYREHWLWLIVGFLGGIFGALLVNWLSSGD